MTPVKITPGPSPRYAYRRWYAYAPLSGAPDQVPSRCRVAFPCFEVCLHCLRCCLGLWAQAHCARRWCSFRFLADLVVCLCVFVTALQSEAKGQSLKTAAFHTHHRASVVDVGRLYPAAGAVRRRRQVSGQQRGPFCGNIYVRD